MTPRAMYGSQKFGSALPAAPCYGHGQLRPGYFQPGAWQGAGTTFFISACTVTASARVVGTLIGALTGYFGGLVRRGADAHHTTLITAFPSILLALVFIAVLGLRQIERDSGVLGILPSFPALPVLCAGNSLGMRDHELCQIRPADGGRAICGSCCVHILPNTWQVLLPALAIGFQQRRSGGGQHELSGHRVSAPGASLWADMLSGSQSYMAAGRPGMCCLPALSSCC